MAEEAYQPPTLIPQPNEATAAQSGTIDHSRPVRYICGRCTGKVMLKRSDVVRCNSCGYRILYKERTSRLVQFEAR